MKKRYLIIIYALIITFTALIFFFPTFFLPGVDPALVDLIILNLIIYLIRTPIIRLVAFIFDKNLMRILISTILNLIWAVFIMWFIFVLSFDLFIAIISFLIVAISLTFKKVINNIASGVLMLTTEQFEIGDLIKTNDITGVVEKITLNYTRIKELDGISVTIPNNSVFGSMLTKYTYTIENLIDISEEETEERLDYEKFLQITEELFEKDEKITRFDQGVEVTSAVDPNDLDRLLNDVFDDYEPRFGIRPDYVVDMVTVSRCKIDLLITAKSPSLVLQYLDAFLRDIIFKLHSEAIYNKWEEYKEKLNNNGGEDE
ncbi:MAG: mechanosensitive ion channel [Candidatus Lokiarchaeota archaeon]|nr:mechanosensitive ion channel [Candidatus Lokiarchaeota archaeon]MBD3198634.1 mechanosensitive ion channel [Candidatus Lokiarchaeota archaeon]